MVLTWSLYGPSMFLISIHLLDMSQTLSEANLENLNGSGCVAHILKLMIAQL